MAAPILTCRASMLFLPPFRRWRGVQIYCACRNRSKYAGGMAELENNRLMKKFIEKRFSTSCGCRDDACSSLMENHTHSGDHTHSSDTQLTDSFGVDLHIVEEQLRQILEARKKFLNDSDFSRVFYHKISPEPSDAGLQDAYKHFVVTEDQIHVPPVSEEDFWTKLKNFDKSLGLTSDEIEDIKLESSHGASIGADTAEQTARKERRSKHFDHELKCFIEACVHANLMTLARTTVIQGYFGNKHKRSSAFRFSDVSIYNVLLQAYASQGRTEHIKTLLKMMSESGIEPNLQSHVIVLECLGRAKNINRKEVMDVEKKINALGFTLDEIPDRCKLTKESKHYISLALNSLDDQSSLQSQKPPEMYDNVLLERLEDKAEQVRDLNPYSGVVTEDVINNKLDQQMELELDDYVTIKSIWDKQSPEATPDGKKRLRQWTRSCKLTLRKAFDRNVKYLRMKAEGGSLSMYPYMKVLPAEAFVDLMMEEIRAISSESLNYSPSLSFLSKRLGYKVMRKYNMARKVKAEQVDSLSEFYKDYWSEYNQPDIQGQNHRVMWQSLARNSKRTDLDIEEQIWPAHIVRNVGKFLFDLILYETKLTMDKKGQKKMPAFYTIYRSFGSKTKQEIKPHPSLAKLYARADEKNLHFDIAEVPMLVPPIPWISVNYGGNLLNRTKLIRLPDSTYRQTEVLNTTPAIQLNPVFDALNTLSSCAWRINEQVLDNLLHVFRSGGNTNLDIPTPPDPDSPLPEVNNTMTPEERSKAIRQRIKTKRERAEMFSLWCNELYRLSIADQFRKDVFWFPHNMDFRGRVYPTPPHFNHLGSDVVRSMMLFAKGKPLGKHGLDWLKIHLINLTGIKKRFSNQERLDYANEILDEILDSADKPLDGHKWWQQSEEPWQTLAMCIEIAKACRCPDPEKYVCHIPVHQDGSFNGLQHYAALGRDQTGAESVNLSPAERPADVYSDVAEMVEKIRQQDALDGLEVAQELDGFIKRKVIKQTVMTTVYGVTKYGAKYQILKQLKYLDEFNQDLAWQASVYLTDKTFHCLREMFTATREIQDTLVLYAQTILKYRNRPLEWTTPLGLPVVQPYNKGMKNKSVIPVGSSFDDHPHAVKQKNAFPPNYIHSLDSTHMMLTALYCLRAGITYVSVHDCYWTHACDVDVMNQICRQQFVALHSQPILENLSDSLVEKYGYSNNEDGSRKVISEQLVDILGRIPRRGEFDLAKVLKSVYFFS